MAENGPKTGTRFAKGNPGGPGRPKVNEAFRDRCRKFVTEHILDCWEKEILGGGEDWLRASELMTAYGFGKPTQPLSGDEEKPPLIFRIEREK